MVKMNFDGNLKTFNGRVGLQFIEALIKKNFTAGPHNFTTRRPNGVQESTTIGPLTNIFWCHHV
jgi:hypothetical protein